MIPRRSRRDRGEERAQAHTAKGSREHSNHQLSFSPSSFPDLPTLGSIVSFQRRGNKKIATAGNPTKGKPLASTLCPRLPLSTAHVSPKPHLDIGRTMPRAQQPPWPSLPRMWGFVSPSTHRLQHGSWASCRPRVLLGLDQKCAAVEIWRMSPCCKKPRSSLL